MSEPGAPPPRAISPGEAVLLGSVFVVAACGLVYELAAGALASYLLGDSVLQFSTVIGAYLAAMGAGSWLSRHVHRQLVAQFVRVELLVAIAGGLMPAALFVLHGMLPDGGGAAFRVGLYGLVGLIGILVGLEIPLAMRILRAQWRERYALRDLVAQVLTFDYLGALVVAVAFPVVFVPRLGLLRTSVFFGLLNALVACWALALLRAQVRARGAHALACGAVVVALLAAFAGAERVGRWTEERYYGEPIVAQRSTPYQRIVVTAAPDAIRLYLNGNLQFASHDEYRYHEALVHPVLAAHGAPRRVLVLGGGDGMAVREILRHPGVESVTLVELDPEMVHLFRDEPRLARLNDGSLADRRLQVVNADAFAWLETVEGVWDVAIVDFPDPSSFSLGKLYTATFYERLTRHLAASGYMVVQTTSPLIARRSFWTVVATLEAVGLATTPYHVHVPSFGEWGFVVAGHRPWRRPDALPPGLRFLTLDGLDALLHFPPDMARLPVEPNRLSNQVLVHTFEAEWGRVHGARWHREP